MSTMYPLEFTASTTTDNLSKTWKSLGKEEVSVGIPPEFGGDEEGCSPEHLYLLALLNCYVATFKVIAGKSNLSFESIKVDGKLIMDNEPDRGPWMKKVILSVELENPSDRERAEFLLKKTESSCYIHNSVLTEKEFHYSLL